MCNIVLIGFMGSGKSTIARILSQKLCMPHIDSDTYIEAQEQKKIKEIFAQKGEAYFRNLELQFIESFCKKNGYIIATGGGMPIFHDARKLGVCFYLQSDFDTICARIENEAQIKKEHVRPLFDDKEKALNLYNERAILYEKAANHIIDSMQEKEAIVANIITILHNNAYLEAKNACT